MAMSISGISEHLVGFGFEIPDAKPFGAEEENILIDKIQATREKAFDSSGKLYGTKKHAKAVAAYENERHRLALRYSFVAYKIAKSHCKQCQLGMGFDDLYSSGFSAILEAIDNWPPFLGAQHIINPTTGKRVRLLANINRCVYNNVYRFLDDHNRLVRVPTYKLEKLTSRLNADEIINGKLIKKTKYTTIDGKKIKITETARKKVGEFEKAIQKAFDTMDMDISEVDNKSLKDIAIETGRYDEIAKIFKCDGVELASIITPFVSLDKSINDEETIGSLIEDVKESNSEVRRKLVEEALEHISEKHQTMLKDYYFANMSLANIAKKNKYSVSRAVQMRQKALTSILNSKTAMNILNHAL